MVVLYEFLLLVRGLTYYCEVAVFRSRNVPFNLFLNMALIVVKTGKADMMKTVSYIFSLALLMAGRLMYRNDLILNMLASSLAFSDFYNAI